MLPDVPRSQAIRQIYSINRCWRFYMYFPLSQWTSSQGSNKQWQFCQFKLDYNWSNSNMIKLDAFYHLYKPMGFSGSINLTRICIALSSEKHEDVRRGWWCTPNSANKRSAKGRIQTCSKHLNYIDKLQKDNLKKTQIYSLNPYITSKILVDNDVKC